MSRHTVEESAVHDLTLEQVTVNFQTLRTEIAEFKSTRIGSGIEPPAWMQRLATELDRVREGRLGQLTDSLMEGEFQNLGQKAIDQEISDISKLNDDAGSGM